MSSSARQYKQVRREIFHDKITYMSEFTKHLGTLEYNNILFKAGQIGNFFNSL